MGQIEEMKRTLRTRFIVNINDLRAHDPAFTARVLARPVKCLPDYFERVVREVLVQEEPRFF